MPDIGEILKLAVRPRVSFCVWVTCLLILFVPFPDSIGVEPAIERFRGLLLIAAIFTFLLWLVNGILHIWSLVAAMRSSATERKTVLAYIDTLPPYEMLVLATAVARGVQSVECEKAQMDGPSLAAKGLLVSVPRANNIRGDGYLIPHVVWKELCTRRKEIIEQTIRHFPNRASQLMGDSPGD